MIALRSLLLTEIRNYTRDWLTLFFTLLFPLIFTLMFGFLMGGIGDTEQAAIGLLMPPEAGFAPTLRDIASTAGVRDVQEFESEESLAAAVADHRVDLGIQWDGATLKFVYNASRTQENLAFQQLAAGLAAEFDLARQGVTAPLKAARIHAGSVEAISWFHLVLPGILAFSMLSSGLFAISGHLTQMKERNILDRLLVTPMRPAALLLAIALVRLVLVFFSTLVTLFVGILVFGLRFNVDWFRYCIFVAVSTLGTMGIGTVIALLVKRPSSAGNIANAMAMIMMFMAGIYFPVAFMPRFLQTLSRAMPLTHMADVMRFVTGVQDMSDVRFWVTTGAFLVTAIVLFPILGRYVVKPLRR